MYRLSAFLFLFLLSSCNDDPLPQGVLPRPKMQAVLHDVLLVDEMVAFLSVQDSNYQKTGRRLALYDSVFQLHAIGKDDYKKSMAYYESRPDLLKRLLDSVHNRLDTARLRPTVPPAPAM